MASDALWSLDLDPLRGYVPLGNSKLRPSYFSTSRSRVSHSWPRDDNMSPPARAPSVSVAPSAVEVPLEPTASPSCSNPNNLGAHRAEELEPEDATLPSPPSRGNPTQLASSDPNDKQNAMSGLQIVAAEASQLALQWARFNTSVASALQVTSGWAADLQCGAACCRPAPGAAHFSAHQDEGDPMATRLWDAGKALSAQRADIKLPILAAVAEAARASATHQSRIAEILDVARTSAGRAHDLQRALAEATQEELRTLRADLGLATKGRDTAAVHVASVRMDTGRVDDALQRLRQNQELAAAASATILAQIDVLHGALAQRSNLMSELRVVAEEHKTSVEAAQGALGQAETDLQSATLSLRRAESASTAVQQLASIFRPAVPICSPARTPAPQRKLATPDVFREEPSAHRPERRLTELTQLAPPIIAWSPMPMRTPRGETPRQEAVRLRRRANQMDLAATVALFHRSPDVTARWVSALQKMDVETLADIRTLHANGPLWRDCLTDNALLKAHLEALIADPVAHDIEF